MASGSSDKLTTGITDHRGITESKRGIWGIHQRAVAAGRFQSMASSACWPGRAPLALQRSGTSPSDWWRKLMLRQLPIFWQNINPPDVQEQEADFNSNSTSAHFPATLAIQALSGICASDTSQNTVPGKPCQPISPCKFSKYKGQYTFCLLACNLVCIL